MKLSNKLYDVLKWICIVGSPATNALLIGLNGYWNWNLPIEAITGTIALITTFIGSCIGISSIKYKKEGAEDGNL